MERYIMFGHSPLFGELLETIRARGGVLKSVVQNIPEPLVSRCKTLRQQIDEYASSISEAASAPAIEIQQLDEFKPAQGDRYIIGFRGHKLVPLRKYLIEKFGLSFAPLIHPSAIVPPTVAIPEGIVIGAGSIIGAGARLGRYMLVNRGALIGHDCRFGDFVNVGPGARIAGCTQVDHCAVIGIGATVIERLIIGKHALVAAGAVVIKDVPDHTLVAGVPATAKKRINENPGDDCLDGDAQAGPRSCEQR